MLTALISRFVLWTRKLTAQDREKIRSGLFSRKSLLALKEVFRESLLHRRMHRVNPLLGYMHMTFAFGWFLLILIGNIESRIFSGTEINLPYYPIFFKYFVHDKSGMPLGHYFTWLMDLLLLFVLSGLGLALIKRTNSRLLGLKRTTNIHKGDRIALFALWLIFPFRLLAESITSGVYHQGGFLTDTLGRIFDNFLPVKELIVPSWWAYSIVLGVFFVSLPFSRYLHIPAEIVLIFIRHYGLKPSKTFDHFSQMELFSCPRCGVCIDKCQLAAELDMEQIPPGHFFHSIRDHRNDKAQAFNCLLCGRCEEVCPVGINTLDVRVQRRHVYQPQENQVHFPFLIDGKAQHAEILYFAGCMTHLTPGIKSSMIRIFKETGLSYYFMDEQGGACCGRPMLMSGRYNEAKAMMEHNQNIIDRCRPVIMVASCPICLKAFKEEYSFNAQLMHHSEFINLMVNKGKITLKNSGLKVSYHDPCELGRGLKIYEEPRTILKQLAELQSVDQEKHFSLCCGGSLGNTTLNNAQRDHLKNENLKVLLQQDPDVLVTSCPLCKKTFENNPMDCKTMDIAEIVVSHLQAHPENSNNQKMAVLNAVE